ncbi:hypothetical protein BXZ70DRAFT_384328 [Cristinia sonorae]|uniref:Uncharacterized protein n=1 Tax=Cristinia sonorae TaxID=1940300 RepID=A0A8K0UIT7_9AGAR|nr:hypothetical protein BXZ70DRAFT_384328 [Cristinia sonorae]
MNDSAENGRRHKQQPVGSPPNQSALAYMSADSDAYLGQPSFSSSPSRNAPLSAPPGSSIQIPDRPNFPTRSSTAPSTSSRGQDPKTQKSFDGHHSRSEDLNHADVAYANDQQASDLNASRSQGHLAASRPTTPASSSNHNQASFSEYSDSSRRRRRSIGSDTSVDSGSSATGTSGQAPPSTTHTSASMSTTYVVSFSSRIPQCYSV